MSEFRQDSVSGDWIIMAPERVARPHDFLPKGNLRVRAPQRGCPFEDLAASGNWPPILARPNAKEWRTILIPNKYPALRHDPVCASEKKHGPYWMMPAIGHHDIAITRDHHKPFRDLSLDDAVELLQIIQERYRQIAADRCLSYASMFFNWGPAAGASLYHPHYQILSLPIIPPDIQHSLDGSRRYFQKSKRCVHCDMITAERRNKVRVISQQKGAIAYAPFASRTPFEIRVFPADHNPFFEQSSPTVLRGVASVLQDVLRRVQKHLRDPDLNFFIHTAPLKGQKRHGYYHWHIEVIPKINIPGGFELSTGVDINVIDPATVAAMLAPKS